MKINRHNYEEFLIDFFEGNLSEEIAAAVESFLSLNPDIKAEAKELFDIRLDADNLKFENKASIKKDINYDIEGITRFEQLSIAMFENEITPEEKSQLNTLVQNSGVKLHELKIINQTKLKPDTSVVFKEKNKLKHYQLAINRKMVYLIASLAASIALIFGLMFNFSKDEPTALALNAISIDFEATRAIYKSETINQPYDNEIIRTVVSKNSIEIDTFNVLRETSHITFANIKKNIQLDNVSGNISQKDLTTSVVNMVPQNTKIIEPEIEDYINRTLRELDVDQQVGKKSTLVEIGKATKQFLGKMFKKKIQIEKITSEDGRNLYAVKAGSLEFYASTKAGRKKEKQAKRDE